MRRIALALMSTIAAVVLLFGYRTSTPHPALAASAPVAAGGTGGDSTGDGGAVATPSAPTSDSPAVTASPSGVTSPSATAASKTRTVTGQAVDTRWGPVQVQITVSGRKVTAVTVLEQPSDNGRDQEINSYALPVLTQEALAAQSASIDSVSGATFTSQGYIGSLQSALDTAGL